jgi:tetratricopeptide (TPR) repeat protein
MNKPKKKAIETQLQTAFALINKNHREEAAKIAATIAADPIEESSLNFALAQLFFHLQNYMNAIDFYFKALAVEPENALYMAALGSAYIESQQPSYAGAILTKALAIKPDCLEAIIAMGALRLSLYDFEGALKWLTQAAERKSIDFSVYSNLALVLGLLGRQEESLQYAEKARRLNPRSPHVLCALAKTLINVGQMDAAQRHLKKAIQLDPAFGPAYERLAMCKRFTAQDTGLMEQAEEQLRKGMRVIDRSSLLFALGKMYDDVGNYQKAFSFYQQANTLSKPVEKPDTYSYLINFQKKICIPTHLASAHTTGHLSDVPVFIVGMPRSGTSLIEQIIASHPQAAGAGELTEIQRITDALYLLTKKQTLLPGSSFDMPSHSVWQQHGEEYLQVLQAGRDSALRVTDKMPENYRFLGFINLLFPNARIIHVVRHPLDVCLSNYFQLFLGVKWSTDLKWIAETYRDYRNIMDYWKKTLPAGKIVDIHYEQLTADPETQGRRLLEASGLDWHSDCLRFFDTNRGVQTASAWQVRQPMYQTSKMRWTKYAPHIHDLANALSDFLQDDRELLEQHGIKLKRKGLFLR